MALLTTGLFENAAVSGVRPSSTLAVRLSNDDTISVTIQIEGFFQSGTTKVKQTLGIQEVGTADLQKISQKFEISKGNGLDANGFLMHSK